MQHTMFHYSKYILRQLSAYCNTPKYSKGKNNEKLVEELTFQTSHYCPTMFYYNNNHKLHLNSA